MEGNGKQLPPPWSLNEQVLSGLNPEAKQALINFEVYQRNMQLMQQITHQMKEIPILKSEIPPENDRNALTKVEFPEEGGVMTYMEGYELPYRGWPIADSVDKIDVIKKIAKASLSGMYHSFKKRPWMTVLLLPAILVLRDIITAGVYTFYRLIERFKTKPLRFSQCMRELHRAFTVNHEENLSELRLMLRDVVCNILEFDNAYRFRAQDILEELNKDSLRNNAIKELKRLIVIAQGRETTQEIKDTWKLIKMFISFYLRFDRKLLRLFTDTLLNLDIEKFKLTPEDKQFCVKRKDYVFGFMK